MLLHFRTSHRIPRRNDRRNTYHRVELPFIAIVYAWRPHIADLALRVVNCEFVHGALPHRLPLKFLVDLDRLAVRCLSLVHPHYGNLELVYGYIGHLRSHIFTANSAIHF